MGVFTSQYAPVGWGFVKICNDVKSTKSPPWPVVGGGEGGGGSGFQLISALDSNAQNSKNLFPRACFHISKCVLGREVPGNGI